MKRIIITSGGTAGHIFPGLAVAYYLIQNGWKVYWLGSSNHIEATLVPQYGIDIKFINMNHGFCGKSLKLKLVALLSIPKAIWQAKNILKICNPDIILSMGGYISIPGVLASWICDIPIIIHEQNSVAGLANKLLSIIAHKKLQAFPNVFSNAKLVGNPVRKEILVLKSSFTRLIKRTGLIRILVIGGSQGAQFLNEIMPVVASNLYNKITIWHQAGQNKKELIKVNLAYTKIKKLKYRVIKFIKNIAIAYSWADMIICRSGALTVSEIATIGLPAIFIPFNHKDCHQYLNAVPLQKSGVAKIIKQSAFTVDYLSKLLFNLNRIQLLKMARCAKTFFVMRNSTVLIAKEIMKLSLR